MKHTKGPWNFNENSFDKTITAKNDIYHGVIVFDEGCFETEEGEANARLISCAPEMLEALIECYMREANKESYMSKVLVIIIERATGLNIEEVLKCTE